MEFPQYRELKGFNRFYKIVDDRNFIEVYFIGTKVMSHEIEAKQYLEILRIQDMLKCESPFVEITEEEFLRNY